LIIAIDGPGGSGKSTVARSVARRLGFTYIDSGAMYRAVALWALRLGMPLDDLHRLEQLAREARIDLPGDRVRFRVQPWQDSDRDAVTAECDSPRPPNRDGFAWTVLAALTNEVAAAVDGDKLTVTLARGTSDPE